MIFESSYEHAIKRGCRMGTSCLSATDCRRYVCGTAAICATCATRICFWPRNMASVCFWPFVKSFKLDCISANVLGILARIKCNSYRAKSWYYHPVNISALRKLYLAKGYTENVWQSSKFVLGGC